MFTTNSLCLTACPIYEWRLFFKIFKSNLSSFTFWKTSSFVILSVQLIFTFFSSTMFHMRLWPSLLLWISYQYSLGLSRPLQEMLPFFTLCPCNIVACVCFDEITRSYLLRIQLKMVDWLFRFVLFQTRDLFQVLSLQYLKQTFLAGQIKETFFPYYIKISNFRKLCCQGNKGRKTISSITFNFAIYVQSNEIHNLVAPIKFLLVVRFQLYMFRTVTVHPQELLFRYYMCRLW